MNNNGHTFLAMWDMHGLEYLVDITADEQRVVWEKLQGKNSPRHSYANPLHLKLRAQANVQRHYEIYLFSVSEGITEEDVRQMFENSPQHAADTIRQIGNCYHSDRVPEDHTIAIR